MNVCSLMKSQSWPMLLAFINDDFAEMEKSVSFAVAIVKPLSLLPTSQVSSSITAAWRRELQSPTNLFFLLENFREVQTKQNRRSAFMSEEICLGIFRNTLELHKNGGVHTAWTRSYSWSNVHFLITNCF